MGYFDNKSDSFKYFYEDMSEEDIINELKADAKVMLQPNSIRYNKKVGNSVTKQIKITILHLNETGDEECKEYANLLSNEYYIDKQ